MGDILSVFPAAGRQVKCLFLSGYKIKADVKIKIFWKLTKCCHRCCLKWGQRKRKFCKEVEAFGNDEIGKFKEAFAQMRQEINKMIRENAQLKEEIGKYTFFSEVLSCLRN